MKYSGLSLAIFLMIAACGNNAENGPTTAPIPSVPVDTLSVSLAMGSELGDSTETFGAISDVLFDEQGNILVLDQVEGTLKMFSPSGDYLMHVAGRGGGPGELQLPWDMFSLRDGRLMVMDPGKQGFEVFDDSLRFCDEQRLWTDSPPFQGSPVSDSQYVAYKIDQDVEGGNVITRRKLALFTYGEEDWESVFWQDSLVFNMNEIMEDPSKLVIELLDPLSICTDESGNVYFSLKDSQVYRVLGWSSIGDSILDIGLDLPPVEKTREEIAAESLFVSSYVSRMNGGGGGYQFQFNPDPYKDMVTGLGIGPDHNLWVERGTTQYPFFDVFDPHSGELLRHVVFPREGWSWRTVVTSNGIAAWEEDPELGYQQLYILSEQ